MRATIVMPTPPPQAILRRVFGAIGPGLISGAADDDPSGIATYVQTGAQFGYAQLWTALFALPLLTAVQEASARIGAVTGKGLALVVRDRYGVKPVYAMVLLLLLANIINLGADLGAMAAAAQLLIPLPLVVLAVAFAVGIVAVETFTSYRAYARILKWLTVALLAYPITVFVVHEPWSQILRATFVPQLQLTPAFLFIITGVLGTTITPYMFFWEASQEVEELHQRGVVSLKAAPRVAADFIWNLRLDNIGGMLASQAVSWCVIVVGATVLNAGGATSVNSAADAAKALLPLVHTFPHAGLLAELLFAVGIVALGLLAVPVLAASSGYAVSEVAGWPEGLNLKLKQAHGFYGVIAAGTLIGLAMNFVGLNPVRALIIAAVVNGAVAPPLIAVLALIARNESVMGKYRSGRLSSSLLWTTCAGMSAAAIALVVSALHR
jgi:NRAMP (natural resistance-associated macrophage protein)-like metal ion transporter